MAKSPAKNITSLPSQTIVPTDVELGLLITGGATVSMVEVIPLGYLTQLVWSLKTARFSTFFIKFQHFVLVRLL